MEPDAFGSWIRALFLPAMGIAIVPGVGSRLLPPGRRRTAMQIASAVLFVLPLVAVVLWMNRSIELVLFQEGVSVFVSTALAIGTLLALRMRPRPFVGEHPSLRRRRSNVVAVLLFGAVVSGGGAVVFGARFLMDLALLPTVVEGRVTDLTVYRPRYFLAYKVSIDGKRYGTTRDVFVALQRGDMVRADVGAGSSTVLKIERQ